MMGPQTDTEYGTRRKRRNAVKTVISCLRAIRDAEQKCLDNVPEVFRYLNTSGYSDFGNIPIKMKQC